MWAYYNNSAFGDISQWLLYRQAHGLYRGIRRIPANQPQAAGRLLYIGVVYQGEWAARTARMVEKTCAIPWDERTPSRAADQAIRGLPGQLAERKALLLRYARRWAIAW